MRLTKAFTNFFESEKSGGIVLIAATITSLMLANSSFSKTHLDFWQMKLGAESLTGWINDGLMTIFFLLIGLELEREVYIGELSEWKKASLPLFAAVGGMVLPAAIYLAFNYGTPTQSGAGIPMATDIAFAIGILSLLGKRIPASLKVFLTALAVIDDLGAIFVIAIFYTNEISFLNLGIAMGIFALLGVFNLVLKIRNVIPYLVGGVFMWYFMHHSGVHATITGVLVAFAIPFHDGSEKSISYKLQHWLHMPVGFIILPLFALANTGIKIDDKTEIGGAMTLGIVGGLALGKPVGIWLFSRLAVLLKIGKLPYGVKWKHILGAGMLGGIGFTMSIFIALLAFDDAAHIASAKLDILIASGIAGVLGFVALRVFTAKFSSKISGSTGT